jgi:hypothetical protein
VEELLPLTNCYAGLSFFLLAITIPSFSWLEAPARLGRMSFGTYLSHIALFNLCVAIGFADGLADFGRAVTYFSVTVIASFALTMLLSRWRATGWIVGTTPPPRARITRTMHAPQPTLAHGAGLVSASR